MVAMSLPKAVAALALVFDSKTNTVILTVKSETGSAYEIKLHPGIVAGIVAGLIALGKTFGPKAGAEEIDAQPITVTSIQSALLPDGRPILDLVLESSLHFPVTFPLAAIPGFQNELARLQELTSANPPPQTTHH